MGEAGEREMCRAKAFAPPLLVDAVSRVELAARYEGKQSQNTVTDVDGELPVDAPDRAAGLEPLSLKVFRGGEAGLEGRSLSVRN